MGAYESSGVVTAATAEHDCAHFAELAGNHNTQVSTALAPEQVVGKVSPQRRLQRAGWC